MRGRSHLKPASSSHPAGLRKRLAGQESTRPNKLLPPAGLRQKQVRQDQSRAVKSLGSCLSAQSPQIKQFFSCDQGLAVTMIREKVKGMKKRVILLSYILALSMLMLTGCVSSSGQHQDDQVTASNSTQNEASLSQTTVPPAQGEELPTQGAELPAHGADPATQGTVRPHKPQTCRLKRGQKKLLLPQQALQTKSCH